MKETALALGLILALLVGGIFGYLMAVEQVQKEAVANGSGHWTIVDGRVEFAWGPGQ